MPLALVKGGKVVTWGPSPGWRKGCDILEVTDDQVAAIVAAGGRGAPIEKILAPDAQPSRVDDPPATASPPPTA